MNMKNKPGNIPDVIGGDELLAKFSEVDLHGQMNRVPIDGLIFRMSRPVAHDDGHVTEVARISWTELVAPIVQVHITTTLPGRILAFDRLSMPNARGVRLGQVLGRSRTRCLPYAAPFRHPHIALVQESKSGTLGKPYFTCANSNIRDAPPKPHFLGKVLLTLP